MLLMLLGCLLLFGGIFAFKWFGKTMMNRAFDSMPLPPATVSSAPVAAQRWKDGLAVVGTLRAINGVQVTTQAEGEVKAIHFKSGQSAKKGDLLVKLAAGPETAQLQVLQAELRLAERTHRRIETLRGSGVATQAEMDEVQSTLDRILASIAVQRATLAEHSVYAPFSGVLGIRLVDLGQNVKPGDAVVSLQQLNPIYADFALPERDFARVSEDLPITLTTSAYPTSKFTGRITAINPAVDVNSRNFQVQATLDNPNHRLHPGMFADVTVELRGDRRVLVVPRTAISFAPYGNAVFVLQKSKEGDGLIAIKRLVKTGEERGDLVEITEGVREGEQIATSGLLKLRTESAVIINNENPPPAQIDPKPENS
jgi:membrane fusion protein (multidrug efflux system)